MTRGISVHDTLVISNMKKNESDPGVPGKKEKGRCDSVKFSGVKNGDRHIYLVGKEKQDLPFTLVCTNQ